MDKNERSSPQYLAANPFSNNWVNASAGTGKTKLLIDRLLNFILSGTPPHKILCITFTRATADEMHQRLLSSLKKWCLASPETLLEELDKHQHSLSPNDHKEKCEQLYSSVVDKPPAIQTIHSFCQTLLRTFPYEAGLLPFFHTLDPAKAKKLWSDSFKLALHDGQNKTWVDILYHDYGSNYLEDLCQELANSPYPLFMEEFFEGYDLKNPALITEMVLEFCKTHSIENYEKSKATLLTKDGTIRKKIKDVDQITAELLYQFDIKKNKVSFLQKSYALFKLFQSCKDIYNKKKKRQNVLDFSDLIHFTQNLLSLPIVQKWIHDTYDHILIDEAQDTSTQQWQLIQQILSDFWEVPSFCQKTLLVVGDGKQSIYSFQGACVKTYLTHTKVHFETSITQCQHPFQEITMDLSYRSHQGIIDVVNDVFEKGLSHSLLGWVKHYAHRQEGACNVVLWPLIEASSNADDNTKKEGWTFPDSYMQEQTPKTLLAEKIVSTLQQWQQEQLYIPSKQRAFLFEDVMILFKRRSSVMVEIAHALQRSNIPVVVDTSILLADHLIVKDITALLSFLSLPTDDYSLACVLKSPLFGLNEDEIQFLCLNREGSLFERLQSDLAEKLSLLKDQAHHASCFRLIQNIIDEDAKKRYTAIYKGVFFDIFDQVLEAANAYDRQTTKGLHGFGDYLEEEKIPLKSSSSTGVRLLSVHGSKGLQSPIVILADSDDPCSSKNDHFTLIPSKNNHLTSFEPPLRHPREVRRTESGIQEIQLDSRLRGNDDGGSCLHEKQVSKEVHFMPVLCNQCLNTWDLYKHHKDQERQDDANEYLRLLYVAMTRAEDFLYFGGIKRSKKEDTSWYHILQRSLKNIGHLETDLLWGDYYTYSVGESTQKSATSDFLENPPDEKTKEMSFFKTLLSQTPTYQISKNKSESIESSQPSSSTQRGLLIHRLFEHLSHHPSKEYLSKRIKSLLQSWKENLKEEDIDQIISIIQHETWQDFFKTDAQAEVPLYSSVSSKIGRIDRLLVTQKSVYVLDFKTDEKKTALGKQDYASQLRFYKETLEHIFPGKKVKAYILWTTLFECEEIF